MLNISINPYLPMDFHFLPGFFFFPSAGSFPGTIPLILLLPSLRLLQKSFATSIIFLPSICQAFLKSPVLGSVAATLKSECNITDVCWCKPFLRTGVCFLHYQVKMTLLKNIPCLVRVKGTWEKRYGPDNQRPCDDHMVWSSRKPNRPEENSPSL